MDQMQNRFPSLFRFLSRVNALLQSHWRLILMAALTCLSVWAGYRFAWATQPNGIGVRSDSVAYFWSAHNLAGGVGLGRITSSGDFKPMTHWPPLYPMVLSLFELAGIPALNGARFLGIFLFMAIIFLTGLCIARFTRSFWFAFLGAAILALCPGFWETGLYAMTEPLYLVFSLVAFLTFDQFILTRHWRWLAACSVSLACGFMTRYIGFTLVGAFIVVILIQNAWSFQQRLKRAFVLGSISIFPILLWMIRNAIQGGTPTNRSLQYYPVSIGDFNLAWQTFSGWFEPDQVIFQVGLGKILVIMAGLLIFFLLAAVSKPVLQAKVQSWIPACSIFYLVFYCVGVLGSRYFLDPLITFFEQRIIFLIYIPLLFIVLFIFNWLFNKAREKSIYWGAVVLVIAILFAYSYVLVYQAKYEHFVDDSHERGLDYSDKTLKSSCLMPVLKDLSSDTRFFTDNIERLYFFTQRNSDQINDEKQVIQLSQDKTGSGIVFVFFTKSEMPALVGKQFPSVITACLAPVIDIIPPSGP